MWRQQKDLVTGVETRLGSKIDAVADKLESGLKAAEERLTERLAREIQGRPIVVHVDMSRVSELEKQVAELAKRVAELEARDRRMARSHYRSSASRMMARDVCSLISRCLGTAMSFDV